MGKKLLFLVVLLGFVVPSMGYEFVKVGTTGRSQRISFSNTYYPDGRASFFNSNNPIINGDNLYAPELWRVGDTWYCYHGGWKTGGQGNDRLYLSISDDMDPNGSWSPQSMLVIGEGVYIHVNDPTIEVVSGTWYMLYTAARNVSSEFTDWINYSTSSNGIDWSPSEGSVSTEISISDPCNILDGNDFSDIARPSVVYDDGLWRLYFDGKVNNGATHSYYAECTNSTPNSFDLKHAYADIAAFPGFYEPDVAKRADGSFVAVRQQGFNELHISFSDSNDGITFGNEVKVLDADDAAFTRKWVSNPGLLYDQKNDVLMGLGFGMTDDDGLTCHDIGFSYTQYKIYLRSPNDIWHVYGESHNLDEHSTIVFDYTDFDLVQLIDPVSGSVVYDQDFTDANVGDLWELRPSKAWDERPMDLIEDVDPNDDLIWAPGSDANSHDVYFGTDYDRIADANHSYAEFRGNQDANSYEPNTLSTETTYYWAIDEINDTNTWMGNVWTFTTKDTTAPSPDPMTWATKPYSTGTSSIKMVATTASDTRTVEYYFDETTGHSGGSDSDWQLSTTYEDTGLSSGTSYSYRVQARDVSTGHNTTGWSSTESATTDEDCGAPAMYRDGAAGNISALTSAGNALLPLLPALAGLGLWTITRRKRSR